MATLRVVIALLCLMSCTSTKTNQTDIKRVKNKSLSEVCEYVTADECEIRK